MLCCSPAATVWCAAWQRGFGVPKAGLVPVCSCLWSWMCCSTRVARLRTSPPPIPSPISGPASLRITRATPPPAPPWRPPNACPSRKTAKTRFFTTPCSPPSAASNSTQTPPWYWTLSYCKPWTTLAGHPACSTARSAAHPARIALSTRRPGERCARNAVRRDPPPRPRRRCG